MIIILDNLRALETPGNEEARIAYERKWRSGYSCVQRKGCVWLSGLQLQMVCCLYYEVKNKVTVIQIIREELLYVI
ncbi:hypothetical protein NC651_034868 [Populus alba x Populus x berolinensis]|nr:hypothetical protein NC651_034868 [Populus alba x Populus x berolinensis]